MANPIYARGFFWNEKKETQPDFVVGSISIRLDDLGDLVQYKNDKGYVKLDILRKKDGTGNTISVNTYGLSAEPRPTPKFKDSDIADLEIPW